jgi:hypothetical protein
MLRSGEQVRGRRAREHLERGGGPPEGVTNHRARRNLMRGGDLALGRGRISPEGAFHPSSEAESHLRGCLALERGGVS